MEGEQHILRWYLGLLSSLGDKKSNIIMVAGGGGGAGTNIVANSYGIGGNGGGINGEDGISIYKKNEYVQGGKYDRVATIESSVDYNIGNFGKGGEGSISSIAREGLACGGRCRIIWWEFRIYCWWRTDQAI